MKEVNKGVLDNDRVISAENVQRIPSRKATNKKRHDCFCQAFYLVAQPLTGARNWRSVSNVNRIIVTQH